MKINIKICGITQREQAQEIINLGINYLGFIQVPASPRYRDPQTIKALLHALILPTVPPAMVGVFANQNPQELVPIQTQLKFNVLQLHGQESPTDCQALKQRFPQTQIWKAFRIRQATDLAQIQAYLPAVDAILLDAYHPQLLGGTGHTLDWSSLRTFAPPCPWFLAGGLTPDNLPEALRQLTPQGLPDGIDVSSGVERSPGDKDLHQVQRLLQALNAKH